ncbi:FAD/NAD(P)-dependent oxidoreductase [Rhodovarius lipocyclicus]|uniref:FAD/NAD(P)-dependent oxidoreductase n=1 Tax=Rhodovarius lipocyclicus TaxID=268410 RepID=UPI001358576B|nr:NAD(P)/FAD-dependent oxidoreductase [Rhodovarius lipocyclicus]
MTDLLILGAGPAGMAAAIEGRRQGLSVLLLDENAAPGGQVHRNARADAKGPGDIQAHAGAALMAELAASGAECVYGATLWAIEPGPRAFYSVGGEARKVEARRIILAPGATERALPIPGWTLPGVMGVGAAQTLLKSAGLVPQGQVWIAGQGPLLWLYAAQALAKGGKIAGILDMSDPGALKRALWHLPCALRKPRYLMLGLAWMRAVRKAVPVHRGRDIQALGDGKLEAVVINGTRHQADTLLLHDGVVPNTQITRAIQGLEHSWNERQRAFQPVLDAYGNTNIPGIMVAGDSGGIGGAWAAALSGRIAALGAAQALGRFGEEQRDALAGPLMLRRGDELAPRGFLDTLFAPLPLPEAPATILCRCEEVTRATIEDAAQLGCLGVNQLKAFTRAGMGACQGRICHGLLHAAIAEARHVPPAEVEAMRTRFPTKPLTIGELAALAE